MRRGPSLGLERAVNLIKYQCAISRFECELPEFVNVIYKAEHRKRWPLLWRTVTPLLRAGENRVRRRA
jgi:hypothetical protein